MSTVKLVMVSGSNNEPKPFSLDHANSIFELQKRCPPATWKLADEAYELKDGKIIERPTEAGVKGSETSETDRKRMPAGAVVETPLRANTPKN